MCRLHDGDNDDNNNDEESNSDDKTHLDKKTFEKVARRAREATLPSYLSTLTS